MAGEAGTNGQPDPVPLSPQQRSDKTPIASDLHYSDRKGLQLLERAKVELG